jgi:2-polyprenyl-3-methyl-5-hydroxy-6-metoxy-1,4-benzoquinol methylase
MTEPSRTEVLERWNKHAEAYAARFGPEGDPARRMWLNRPLFELLGPLAERRILDAGCGEGYLSRLLAERGAKEVVAMDAAREMLRLARERTPENSRVEYREGDIQALAGLEDASFDLAVSNMVVQDVPRHDLALSAVARVLKPGGALVFSILHPCFQAPGAGWDFDDQGRRLRWRMGRYFEEIPTEDELAPGTDIRTFAYHRTLTNYFEAIASAGFVVEALVEPRPQLPPGAERPADYDVWKQVALFLILKVRKPI